MWPNVGYDGMGGMYYLRVILLKKLEGMAPVPYPIQNRVNIFTSKDDDWAGWKRIIYTTLMHCVDHWADVSCIIEMYQNVSDPSELYQQSLICIHQWVA